MSDNVLAGIDFGSAVRDVTAGLIVKPLLENYLYDASFPAFTMHFPAEEMHREPDGWFHPSTHPLWDAKALYTYLAHPDRLKVEKIDHSGALSITVGKAVHGFAQMCLEQIGIRPPELQKCTICPPEADCDEFGVLNEELGERGHLDGVLDLSSISTPLNMEQEPVWEFKTTNERRIFALKDMDLAAFTKAWPEYVAQQQRYQRLSGKRLTIVTVMSLGIYPWQQREFHIPYDPTFNHQIDEKYRSVRQAVIDGRAPRCCGRYKSCPAGPMCQEDL